MLLFHCAKSYGNESNSNATRSSANRRPQLTFVDVSICECSRTMIELQHLTTKSTSESGPASDDANEPQSSTRAPFARVCTTSSTRFPPPPPRSPRPSPRAPQKRERERERARRRDALSASSWFRGVRGALRKKASCARRWLSSRRLVVRRRGDGDDPGATRRRAVGARARREARGWMEGRLHLAASASGAFRPRRGRSPRWNRERGRGRCRGRRRSSRRFFHSVTPREGEVRVRLRVFAATCRTARGIASRRSLGSEAFATISCRAAHTSGDALSSLFPGGGVIVVQGANRFADPTASSLAKRRSSVRALTQSLLHRASLSSVAIAAALPLPPLALTTALSLPPSALAAAPTPRGGGSSSGFVVRSAPPLLAPASTTTPGAVADAVAAAAPAARAILEGASHRAGARGGRGACRRVARSGRKESAGASPARRARSARGNFAMLLLCGRETCATARPEVNLKTELLVISVMCDVNRRFLQK